MSFPDKETVRGWGSLSNGCLAMSTSWQTVAKIARGGLVLGILAQVFSFATAASGQDAMPDAGRAGVWYAGRYFGFDPQRAPGAVDEDLSVDLAPNEWFEPTDEAPFGMRRGMNGDRLCLAGTGVYA